MFKFWKRYRSNIFSRWPDKNKELMAEPFPLFGIDSTIYTKEQAAKVATDNSYYFIVAGCIPLIFATFFALSGLSVPGLSISYLVFIAIFYLSMAFAIRSLKSRVASILVLAATIWAFISCFIVSDHGGFILFHLVFLAASARAVKATFIFQKKSKGLG